MAGFFPPPRRDAQETRFSSGVKQTKRLGGARQTR